MLLTPDIGDAGFKAADLATPTVGGQRLLHHAAMCGCSTDVLRAVLAADPAVASVTDGGGKVPPKRRRDPWTKGRMKRKWQMRLTTSLTLRIGIDSRYSCLDRVYKKLSY